MDSFFGLLESYAKNFPDRQAFITPEYRMTYKQLYHTVAYYQKAVANLKKKVIFIKTNYAVNFAVYFLASLAAGVWAVPIWQDITCEDYERIKEELAGYLINPTDSIIKVSEGGMVLEKPSEDTSGIYHRTSGSTGIPKFCIRSTRNLMYEGLSYRDTLGITENDTILNVPPLIHSYALGVALFGGVVSGAAVCLLNGFMPKTAIELVKKEQVTIIILVPYMARILVRLAKKGSFSNQLRIALSGSGVIDEQLDRQFKEVFGIKLDNNYGSTETGGLICTVPDSPVSSLGRPMKGVEIKIRQEDQAGDTGGILWVRTKALTSGYIDGSSLALDKEGYYNTGDIVKIGEGNNLFYCGRTNKLINIGGKKVSPEEIEQVLKSFPEVEDCYIYAECNSFHVFFIIAVIECREWLEESILRKRCREKLSDYKVPRKIIAVNKIPRNKVGKVEHEAIQHLVLERDRDGVDGR